MASVTSTRAALAQVLVCATGCCCGRTDRHKPPLPLDWIKQTWKARQMMKSVQLTIAGCLGPCDVVNVAAIALPDRTIWLGRLLEQASWQALADWAEAVHHAQAILPLPDHLVPHVFERWRTAEAGAATALPAT